MQPRKLRIAFGFLNYGSNGGIASEHPDIRHWAIAAVKAANADERIYDIVHRDIADTPVTMSRNQLVKWAKAEKADVLIMCDSDQAPDLYLGVKDQHAQPFFESSFDFLYKHWDRGPVAIFAPYCGPPGHPINGGFENVYVFKWQSNHSDMDHRDEYKLDPYDRAEAQQMCGIVEAGAGPTGLCMIDMRCFEYMTHPYFYYQYEEDGEICPHCGQFEPGPQAEKSTTEDIAFFRDLSLAGCATLGYNPVLCNWDAWAGHHKPICVGKPNGLSATQVSAKLKRALDRGGNHRRLQTQMHTATDADRRNAIRVVSHPPETIRIPEQREKFWGPDPRVLKRIEEMIGEGQNVLEVGPGDRPFSRAQTFVDWRTDNIDISRDTLPFSEKEFDFVYCRHTLEDLIDPIWAASEIERVGCAGYIETPSPIAELAPGVDNLKRTDGSDVMYRGYCHHRWIIWSFGGALHAIQKYPIIDALDLPDRWDLLQGSSKYWNTYHVWEGSINFAAMQHDRDYTIQKDYRDYLIASMEQSQKGTDYLWEHLNIEPEARRA